MITSSLNFKYINAFVLCGILTVFVSQEAFGQNEAPPNMQEIMQSMQHLQNDPEFKAMMEQMGGADVIMEGMQMMSKNDACLREQLGDEGQAQLMQKMSSMPQQQERNPEWEQKMDQLEATTRQICASGQREAANQYYEKNIKELNKNNLFIQNMEKYFSKKEQAALENCGELLGSRNSKYSDICHSYEVEKQMEDNARKMMLQHSIPPHAQ